MQIVAGALAAAQTDCRWMVMTACCILISLFGVKRHQYLSKTKDGFNSEVNYRRNDLLLKDRFAEVRD